MADYKSRLSFYADEFNAYAEAQTESLLSKEPSSFGSELMVEAMKYSLITSGKRIRPALCLEFCRLCSGDYRQAMPLALAVETVHTYSLIHDDLPCMDDDDYRRGKLSSHKKFGYANALLAGDALLTLAFEIIASCDLDDGKKVRAAKILSSAAGYRGMVAGQVMDLRNESVKADLECVEFTDELKTGEMIRASGLLGCAAAGEYGEKADAAESFCGKIGLAFQIVDDILDVEGSSEELGKAVGSDEKNDKSTYVSLLGVEKAKALALSLTDDAVKALDVFGSEADFLRELAYGLVERKK